MTEGRNEESKEELREGRKKGGKERGKEGRKERGKEGGKVLVATRGKEYSWKEGKSRIIPCRNLRIFLVYR